MQNLYKKHKSSIDTKATEQAKQQELCVKTQEVRQLLYEEYGVSRRDFTYAPGLSCSVLLDAICKRMVEESDAEML